MKERVTIRKKGQVTLPKALLERYNLQEGDSLDIEENERGELVLIPLMLIPRDQAWFWTKEWQEGEREAEDDIRNGRIKSFNNVTDAIAWLDSDED